MTDTFRVLGQAYPVGGVLTTAYTVPGATQTTVSTMVACNQSVGNTTIRISVAVAGAADTAAQYVYYGVTLHGNETRTLTIGMTLAATDVVRVYALGGLVSFNLFGVEIT